MQWLYSTGGGGGGTFLTGVCLSSKELTGRTKCRVLWTSALTGLKKWKNRVLGTMELMAEWKKGVLGLGNCKWALWKLQTRQNVLSWLLWERWYTFCAQIGFCLNLAMCYKAIWGKFGILLSSDEYETSRERSANSAKWTCFVPGVLWTAIYWKMWVSREWKSGFDKGGRQSGTYMYRYCK